MMRMYYSEPTAEDLKRYAKLDKLTRNDVEQYYIDVLGYSQSDFEPGGECDEERTDDLILDLTDEQQEDILEYSK